MNKRIASALIALPVAAAYLTHLYYQYKMESCISVLERVPKTTSQKKHVL